MPSKYRVHATIQASAERVRAEIVHYGTVSAIDPGSCEVHIAAESLDWAAFCLVSIGAPFIVHGPPEAADLMKDWGYRLLAATRATGNRLVCHSSIGDRA